MSCPDCFRGGVSKAEPTGTEATIHGIATYVAKPDEGVEPKGLIVFITDALGWSFVNNRVLADRYAKNGGYVVYVPDFMNGHVLPPAVLPLTEKVMEPSSWFTTIFYKPFWILQIMPIVMAFKRHASIDATKGNVLKFVQDVRTSEPPFATDNLKVGGAGFCWGAKHCFLLARDESDARVVRHESQVNSKDPAPLLDCIFTAHPSSIDVPVDVEALVAPTSVAVGDNDMVMKGEQAEKTKEILEAKGKDLHEVVIMPGAKHGFAIRTHPEDKHEVECADKAEAQALEWFKRWLS